MPPPVGAVHFDPLDVRPANRRTLTSTSPSGTPRRVSPAAMQSIRARVSAVLKGLDPDAEWARLVAEAKAKRRAKKGSN